MSINSKKVEKILKITVRPVGGLCNRLLCINSFFHLCKEIDADLEIYWEKNEELKAHFTELFTPISDLSLKLRLIESDKPRLLYSDRILYKPRQRIYNALLKGYQQFAFTKVFHGYDIKRLINSNFDFSGLKKYKSVYITFWGPLGQCSFIKELFIPLQSLESSFPKIQQKYVGLHIRRADHALVIRETPIEKYYKVIDQEIAANSHYIFYVASDDAKVKRDLKARYGQRIITLNEENASRNSQPGMQDAVSDLYTLSRAERVYGSPKSTFALVSTLLGDIELRDISKIQ